METVFRTDQGKVRRHNEDDGGIFFNTHHDCLAIVADGMGGHKAGDVASRMAVASLSKSWQESGKMTTPDDAEKWFQQSIPNANREILEYANTNEHCAGMGTTLVAAICTELFATIVNIGDSRCYILNENGFQQLTEDHTFVNELVKTGLISHEDAEHHPRKNVVLKALGTETEIGMDVKTLTFEEEDLLLLCSDGLSNKLSGEELAEVLKAEKPLAEKADQLVVLANQNGGEDNITVAIVKQEAESGCTPC